MNAAWTLLQGWRHQGRLRRVDVALAEAAQQALPDTPAAVLLGLALCSRALADGHVALPAEGLSDWFGHDTADDDIDAVDEQAIALHQELRRYLQQGDAAHPLLRAEHGMLALTAYAKAEQALADAIQQRIDHQEPPERAAKTLGEATKLIAERWPSSALGDIERQVCLDSATHSLTILTGGPGTGKTTCIARMVALHLALGVPASRIGLAAPTGKAAARLNAALRTSELLSTESELPVAATVHRLLGLREDGAAPAFDAQRPLPLDVLIVDEASMLDLPRQLALFRALPLNAALVLVGDEDQLPSVEAGSVLHALSLAAGGRRHHLQRVHRQRQGSGILSLAAAVRDGDVDTALQVLAQHSNGLRWDESADAAAIARIAAPRFASMSTQPDPMQALRAGDGFRLLCAVHSGTLGTRSINRSVVEALGQRDGTWFSGRWCLIERNEHALGLFNGDLGLCLADAEGALRVFFADAETPRGFHPQQLGEVGSAFALSVHKAQGSEFDEVLLVLPEAESPLLSREWLYTAITRAKSGLHLIGSEAALRVAVQRSNPRWGTLTSRLRGSSAGMA